MDIEPLGQLALTEAAGQPRRDQEQAGLSHRLEAGKIALLDPLIKPDLLVQVVMDLDRQPDRHLDLFSRQALAPQFLAVLDQPLPGFPRTRDRIAILGLATDHCDLLSRMTPRTRPTRLGQRINE